jgi:hypothetical protein
VPGDSAVWAAVSGTFLTSGQTRSIKIYCSAWTGDGLYDKFYIAPSSAAGF